MKKKNILITGATGSLGKAYIENSIKKKKFSHFFCISRDEAKQFYFQEHLKNKFGEKILQKFTFKLIDISKDYEYLCDIVKLNKINFILNTAAQKQILSAEYNPEQVVRNNIIGTYNMAKLANENEIEKFIHLSTDKSVDPINIYGCSKFIADKIILNTFKNSKTKFSILRYGNVLGSKGSILPYFLSQIQSNKKLIVTHKHATRFCITLDQACEFVSNIFKISDGGEIFIPKIKSIRILDLAKILSSNIGFSKLRINEKLHEKLISTNENNLNVFNSKSFYILTNNTSYKNLKKIKLFDYDSSQADLIKPNKLRQVIKSCKIEH